MTKVTQSEQLLSYVLRTLKGISRTHAKELITSGRIRINGSIETRQNFGLEPGMEFNLMSKQNGIVFNNKWVRIVYEDDYLIVIEKNVGILSARAPHHQFAVPDVLNKYLAHTHRGYSVHVVHRLDRDTSGLMVYAKNMRIRKIFEADWHDRVADRRYYAIVEGHLSPAQGVVRNYLLENKALFVYPAAADDPDAKLAITHYRTAKRTKNFSLVELKLETGRKNQIRVHMQGLGHPVVGDTKYGSSIDPIGRMCLHAFRLCFYHPVTGKLLEFNTPLPAQFTALLARDNKQ